MHMTIIDEVPLLDDVTPIFSLTEVSAHGPIFCRKQLREKIGAIFYRSKSQRTRTDKKSVRQKIGPCALGITHCVPCREAVCTIFMMVFWYDPAGRRTHDLPFERRTR